MWANVMRFLTREKKNWERLIYVEIPDKTIFISEF